MDSVTHTLLGACVGEALAGKKLGKKAMLWGALANNLPDIDVVASLWLSQPDNLLAHRGITHSFLFIFLMTPVAGWVMKKMFRSTAFSAVEWSVLFGVNLFLHLLIDSFTVYGTGLFEPFNHARISFDFIFVADPLYTIPLLVSVIALLILKRSSVRRNVWTAAGLILSSIYMLYTIYHKVVVNQVTENSLQQKKITYSDYIATPTPLNNFLWYLIAKNDSGYHIGYYSVFDQSDQPDFYFIARNDSLLAGLGDKRDAEKLIRFSKGFYHIGIANDTLVFNDLRFGQIGGWDSGDAPFVFQYKLSENTHHEMAIQSGRMQASRKEALLQMIERIKGK